MAFAAYHFADVCMSVRDDGDEVVTINTNLLIAVFQLTLWGVIEKKLAQRFEGH